MKTWVLLISVLLNFLFTQGQEYKRIFLHRFVEDYRGLELKLQDGFRTTLKQKFYSQKPSKESESPVYKPSINDELETDSNALKGRVFVVTNTLPYLDGSPKTMLYRLLELKDKETEEVVYFIYDVLFEFNFPFLVKGYQYDARKVVKHLQINKDDFDDKITIVTPERGNMRIIKLIENSSLVRCFLDISTSGNILEEGRKGVIVLFKDGTKWAKPDATLRTEKDTYGYKYSAFISLTLEDLQLFSAKEVDKFRIYMFVNHVKPVYAEPFKYYAEALMNYSGSDK